MENQTPRFAKIEHELMVDSKTFKEVKECVKFVEAEASKEIFEKLTLIHMRSIDGRYYTVRQTMNNGQLEDTKIETNMEEENEINSFKQEWEQCYYGNNAIMNAIFGTRNFYNIFVYFWNIGHAFVMHI